MSTFKPLNAHSVLVQERVKPKHAIAESACTRWQMADGRWQWRARQTTTLLREQQYHSTVRNAKRWAAHESFYTQCTGAHVTQP